MEPDQDGIITIDGHRFMFLDSGDLLWQHPGRTGGYPHGSPWGTIDLTSGDKHRLISKDPLTIEPSLLCAAEGCDVHGFIREGKWVPA